MEMARKSRKAKESRVGGKRYVTPTKSKAKAAVTKRKGTTTTYKPKPSPHPLHYLWAGGLVVGL